MGIWKEWAKTASKKAVKELRKMGFPVPLKDGNKKKRRGYKGKKGKKEVTPTLSSGWVDYVAYMRSKWWRDRSKQAKRDVGWRCQQCGVKGYLETHHKHYRTLGREEKEDLEVLCTKCHDLRHGIFEEIAEMDRRISDIARYG